MDIKAGHCNGTRYLVKEVGKYRLLLEKLNHNKEDKNTTLLLPRIPMKYGGKQFPFELTRLQFPIKIAFALTINRSQGQSVEYCYLKMYGHMVKYMLHFLGVVTQKIYMYGPNSHSLKSISFQTKKYM